MTPMPTTPGGRLDDLPLVAARSLVEAQRALSHPLFHLPHSGAGSPQAGVFLTRADTSFVFELTRARSLEFFFVPHRDSVPQCRSELRLSLRPTPVQPPSPPDSGYTVTAAEPAFLASAESAVGWSALLLDLLAGPVHRINVVTRGGGAVSPADVQRNEFLQNKPNSVLWLETAVSAGAAGWALGVRAGASSGQGGIYFLQNKPNPALVVHRFAGQDQGTAASEWLSILYGILASWDRAAAPVRHLAGQPSPLVTGLTEGYRNAAGYLRANPIEDGLTAWYEIATLEADLRFPVNGHQSPALVHTSCRLNKGMLAWERNAPRFLLTGPDRQQFLGRFLDPPKADGVVVIAPLWDQPPDNRYLLLEPAQTVIAAREAEGVAGVTHKLTTGEVWPAFRTFFQSLAAWRDFVRRPA